ncbi:MAG: 3-oxoacid CoA-transferase subunit B [Chloroflexi bacterium]|nr:3-oxoacid CoA-transferase subunit B [Chloroflexota bacterium]
MTSLEELAEKDRLPREIVAMRVAKELPDGAYVNLGIGIPTLVSSFVPEGRTVYYHSESGILNCGPIAEEGEEDIDLINAGGQYLQSVGGMSFFDSAEAFAMIRGGHVDVTVLGSHQVSATGDLANWMLPQRGVGNVGGAMDLAAGAAGVIVAMEHTDRQGNPKIVEECTFPLTGKGCAYLIVTDLAVIECDGKGLTLLEVAPGWTPEEVQQLTGAKLTISPDVKEFEL